jgi:hypothetical protein
VDNKGYLWSPQNFATRFIGAAVINYYGCWIRKDGENSFLFIYLISDEDWSSLLS